MTKATSALLSEGDARSSVNPLSFPGESQRGLFAAPQLQQCKNSVAERNTIGHEAGDSDKS